MLYAFIYIAAWFAVLSNPTQSPVDDIYLVIHVESDFSGAARVAQEITISALKHKQVHILTSEDIDWRSNTEVPALNPTHIEHAPGGEHEIAGKKKVTMSGGYFRACFANAVMCLLNNSTEKLEVHMPMKEIYFGAKRTLYEQYLINFDNEKDFLVYLNKIATEQFGFDNPHIKICDDTIIMEE